jgi:putative tryptophan/tyrosine transport system substrate-binding protein
VIFAGEPSAARAVKALTSDLAIVCPSLTDRLPDLFESYSRPGGNVTGVAAILEDLNGKLVQLAIEVIPNIKCIGVLVNARGANRTMIVEQTSNAAHTRGIQLVVEEPTRPDDLAPALEQMVKAGAQIVLVAPNGMFINRRRLIVQQAVTLRLPTLFQQRQDVEAGGLMSYGVNETDGSRRVAAFVDKILKGTKPRDLPIEFPTVIELIVNLTTAQGPWAGAASDIDCHCD